MKRILLFIAAPIIALVLASLMVYHFVDINDYKANIISLVKESTGSDISINGDIRLRILSDIALDISDISVLSGENKNTISVDSIEQIIIHLRLIPLLKRKIEVSSLKLVSPVAKINIFHEEENKIDQDVNLSNAFEKNYTFVRNFINNHIVDKFHLSSLTIEDAKLAFTNEENGIDLLVNNINIQTSFVKGNNPVQISGKIKLEPGIDAPFSIDGQYQLAKDFYELSTLTIKLGDIETHGEAGIDFRSNIPDVKIAFYFQDMNLNPYAGLVDLILISKKPINIKIDKAAKTAPYVWSAEPIDFGILRSFNGHFSFKSNNVVYKDTTIGSVTMNSYLRNGKFTLSVKEAEMLGGNINAEIVVDATSSVAKVRHKINLEEIDFTKLPTNFGTISNLGGRVSGGIMLASRGVSHKELINNVDGSISLRIDDGFIKNIDLVGMAKNINSAFYIGKHLEQKTIFKELAGDFDVRDGLVKTDNLTFGSDLLDFNGQGSANIPELTINFRMMPKIKKAKDEIDVPGGMRAPILISGSLLQPSFRLEVQTLVEDLINNPKGTENLVKQIKRDFDDIKGSMKSDEEDDDNGVVKDIRNILNGF